MSKKKWYLRSGDIECRVTRHLAACILRQCRQRGVKISRVWDGWDLTNGSLLYSK